MKEVCCCYCFTVLNDVFDKNISKPKYNNKYACTMKLV